MVELYKGKPGSPITYLASDISATQTTISVSDDSALLDAPNICTIGYGENIETIKYGVKSNGVLQEVVRGIEGIPQAWSAGTEIARFFTAYDHNRIVDEITNTKDDLSSHLAENVSDIGGVHGLDYEEGEFTPRIIPNTGNVVNTNQKGEYIRINSLVLINFDVRLSSKGDGAGIMSIGGLPFAAKDLYFANLVAQYVDLTNYKLIGRTALGRIVLYKQRDFEAISAFASYSDDLRIYGSLTYSI